MVDVHSFVLAGFVSQATFAMTLALLAWSDRRTRGTRWLAAACLLQLVASAAHVILPADRGISESAGSCGLVLVFFLVYMGMRWFVIRRRVASQLGPLAVSLSMLLILVLGSVHPGAALIAARLISVVVLGFTVAMLLRPKVRALRAPARGLAAMLMVLMSVFLLRVAVSLQPSNQRNAGVETLGHHATMVCVTLLGFSFVGMFVAEAKRRLHEETRLDSLTGLRNRRAFEEIAQQEILLAGREGSPLTLLMMDLDFFKKLNDTWGHALGDRALRAFGGVLLTATGSGDAVARLGGEEFAMLLPGRSARSALGVAERLRATVEGLRLSEGDELVRFTVSIGISSMRPGETSIDAMFRRADQALYQAKRDGRNRVTLAEAISGPAPARVVPELQPVVVASGSGTATAAWQELAG
ncbi:MAG TPA: GGDEF domain-containing protein [Acidobacteriaceae bacterium]|jgi:diguanylate cyclase (GGDEF)-like protein|nr:GGDEF domain-containing protein [Acidobacteriaceae bacterium]